MGGLDWAALPIIVEMFGVMDPQALIEQLVTIRQWKADNKEQPE